MDILTRSAMEQTLQSQNRIRRFIKAAEMVEEKPENCLVVEDALAGIDAAYAGGFISAGIGDAASHKYVTYPIHTFSDLLSIDKL